MKLRTKILIASIIILILSIVVSLVIQYIYKNKSEKQLETSINEVIESTALSTNDTNQIKKIIEEPIQFPAYDLDNNELYYVNLNNNKFFKSNLETKKSITLLPFEEVGDISNAQWNTKSEKVLTTERISNAKKIYDIKENTSNELDSALINLNWLSNDQLVAYYHNSETQENKLITINSQGQVENIFVNLKSSAEPYTINFVGDSDNKLYYMFTEPESADTYLYKIDLNSQENKKIIEQPINNAKLSPDGQKIIYNIYKDEQLTTYLLEIATAQNKPLSNINLDVANILWNNNSQSLYLVQNKLETTEGSGGYTYHLLEKIDKYNLENSQIEYSINITDQGSYGAENFFLSTNDEKLYFVNFENSYLYSIKLK